MGGRGVGRFPATSHDMTGDQPGAASATNGRGASNLRRVIVYHHRSAPLMLQDSTIPLLLGSRRAVDVIRKFKSEERRTEHVAQWHWMTKSCADKESGNPVSAVKSMQAGSRSDSKSRAVTGDCDVRHAAQNIVSVICCLHGRGRSSLALTNWSLALRTSARISIFQQTGMALNGRHRSLCRC